MNTIIKLFLASLIVLGVVWQPTAASAQTDLDPATDGLVVSVDATHTIKPAEGVVEVSETYTYRNVLANTRSGNTITSYSWNEGRILTPHFVEDIEVTSNGRVLEYEELEGTEPRIRVEFPFPSPLRFGQSRTFEVRYTMPLAADSVFVKELNATIFDVEITACCQYENATLRVVIPEDFNVEARDFNDRRQEFERSADGDQQVLTLSRTEADDGFTPIIATSFIGVNPSAAVRTEVAVGTGTVTVVNGVAQTEWQERTTGIVAEVVGAATEITGVDWLTDLELEHGDLGMTLFGELAELEPPLTGTVRLADRYNQVPLARRLVESMVPPNPFEEEFLTEGLVRGIATAGLDRLDGSESERGAPLAGRVRVGGQEWFVQEMTDEIGWEGMMDLLELGATDEVAFLGEGAAETVADAPKDWRRVLDLGEQRLAMENLRSNVGDYLLQTDAEQAEFAERNEHVDRHDLLEDRAGMPLPLGVRAALTRWDFDDAADLLDASESVLDASDDLAAAAAEADIAIDLAPADWGEAETVAELTSLSADYDRRQNLVEGFATRRSDIDRDRGFVGSRSFDRAVAEGALNDAEDALRDGDDAAAEDALDEYDRISAAADSAGVGSLLVPFGLIAIVALVVLVIAAILWRGSRSGRLAAQEDERDSCDAEQHAGDSEGDGD